jgi:4-aminobutyrate aminotransferase
MANARARGEELRAGLELLRAGNARRLKEVRGKGLMIGLELQKPDGSPDPETRDQIIQAAFERGLLLLPCGASTLRFCPPLCLNRRQVELGLSIVNTATAAVLEGVEPVLQTP